MGKRTSTYSKITPAAIKKQKGKKKIAMLTAYDFSFARILDEAGVTMLLVGDSLANVVLGLETTKEVSIREMLSHTRAVARGAGAALIVADMPYASYQRNPAKALYYARKFMAQGAGAVKIEWFKKAPSVIKTLIKNNIPVMGHIGLTPQTADKLGGFKVQGKDAARASELLGQARLLDELGVFSLVIECVPARLAALISQEVSAPTIGIGAGPYCDGQVLVLYDVLGLYRKLRPKFVKEYADFYSLTRRSVTRFMHDVQRAKFPSKEESFLMNPQELTKLKRLVKNQRKTLKRQKGKSLKGRGK